MCCIDVFSLPFAKKIGNKVYLFAVFFRKYLVKMRSRAKKISMCSTKLHFMVFGCLL